MTVQQLIDILKEVDPKAKVTSEVRSANKSVRGIHVVPDGKKVKVVLK